MSKPLEDYALIGDMRTAALVARDGSIDWLCLPRFDSDACLAALLGDEEQGRWLIRPEGEYRTLSRAYRGRTLVVETTLTCGAGIVRLVDFMALPFAEDANAPGRPAVIRIVEGVRGSVRMCSDLLLAFDYGDIRPLWTAEGRALFAAAGPDGAWLDGDLTYEQDDGRVRARFDITEGQRLATRLIWTGPRQGRVPTLDARRELRHTETWWTRWAGASKHGDDDDVMRSLLTLKALTYAPSGGIVAAPTTSLPELIGGGLNWDYRYCWIRDATFTLLALVDAGYANEARDWREWLVRAVSGRADQIQAFYGVDGERHAPERDLPMLAGYERSTPVRVGNAAQGQFQLDIGGELVDTLFHARTHGLVGDENAWALQASVVDFLESNWRRPDNGIWELRENRQQYVHSKVMAWAALDRAVRSVESLGMEGPVARWKALRDEIHVDVCRNGYDPDRGTFTQYYGSGEIDAALLRLAPVGFLPGTDERIRGTVRAIEQILVRDGLVTRYAPMTVAVPGAERASDNAFLACSFWLADNYVLQGRDDEAIALYGRLLTLRNDVGLLAEEYDLGRQRLIGNFPQAFSHVAHVVTALNLAVTDGPTLRRSRAG